MKLDFNNLYNFTKLPKIGGLRTFLANYTTEGKSFLEVALSKDYFPSDTDLNKFVPKILTSQDCLRELGIYLRLMSEARYHLSKDDILKTLNDFGVTKTQPILQSRSLVRAITVTQNLGNDIKPKLFLSNTPLSDPLENLVIVFQPLVALCSKSAKFRTGLIKDIDKMLDGTTSQAATSKQTGLTFLDNTERTNVYHLSLRTLMDTIGEPRYSGSYIKQLKVFLTTPAHNFETLHSSYFFEPIPQHIGKQFFRDSELLQLFMNTIKKA
jgi:hypothetical protein